jgi:hypothetical protein
MTQVSAIIRGALLDALVLDPTQAVKAQDSEDAIRALNLMMRRWEADGIALGWADVAAPADTLPVPPEAEQAIQHNLAVLLQPRYGLPLNPVLVAFARDGKACVMADVAACDAARLDYDLPLGSNSRRYGYFYSDSY